MMIRSLLALAAVLAQASTGFAQECRNDGESCGLTCLNDDSVDDCNCCDNHVCLEDVCAPPPDDSAPDVSEEDAEEDMEDTPEDDGGEDMPPGADMAPEGDTAAEDDDMADGGEEDGDMPDGSEDGDMPAPADGATAPDEGAEPAEDGADDSPGADAAAAGAGATAAGAAAAAGAEGAEGAAPEGADAMGDALGDPLADGPAAGPDGVTDALAADCTNVVEQLGLDEDTVLLGQIADAVLDQDTLAVLQDPSANLTVFAPPQADLLKVLGGFQFQQIDEMVVIDVLKAHVVPMYLPVEDVQDADGEMFEAVSGDILTVDVEEDNISISANNTVTVTEPGVAECSDTAVVHKISGILVPEGVEIDLAALPDGDPTALAAALPPASAGDRGIGATGPAGGPEAAPDSAVGVAGGLAAAVATALAIAAM